MFYSLTNFVLFALRCQTLHHKNTFMIYDEPKIVGCKIIFCNSNQLKVEDICSYNRNNIMSYKLLKLLELLKLIHHSRIVEINQ